MGGRGASSGRQYKFNGINYNYGDEYHSILKFGNINFVEQNNKERAVTAPQETMTKGRIYVTIDETNEPKYITYYNNKGIKVKQIDLKGKEHFIKGEPKIPHTHKGKNHKTAKTRELSPKEQKYRFTIDMSHIYRK